MVYLLWCVGLTNFLLALVFVYILGQEGAKSDRLVAGGFAAFSTINGFLAFLYLKTFLVGGAL